ESRDQSEHHVLDRRLTRRGDRDRVPVAAHPLRDPEDGDLVDPGRRGLFGAGSLSPHGLWTLGGGASGVTVRSTHGCALSRVAGVGADFGVTVAPPTGGAGAATVIDSSSTSSEPVSSTSTPPQAGQATMAR